MSKFIEQHKEIWGDNPKILLDKYDYHPDLTVKLDSMNVEEFNREMFYEIVLWKLSRFPYLEEDLIDEIKAIAKIDRHEDASVTLEKLLRTRGIALPMASTILRFINPSLFQIIDDRAYRVLFPGESKYPSKPANVTSVYIKNSIKVYFSYLTKLHEVSSEKLPFENSDRILYQLDILLNNKIGDK